MAKKKTKDPQQTPQTDTVSTPSSIYDTLFGNAPEQDPTTAALFSDNNPFRRKAPQYAPIPQSTKPIQSPNNGSSENRDSGEEKKKKRNREKNHAEDSDSDSDSMIEVSKKKKNKKKKQGSDEDIKGSSDLVAEANGITEVSKEMKKKKRKREELEKEWEEKKYGMVEGEENGEVEGLGKKQTVGSKRKTVDNAAEMLVSKEGFDDEDKLLRTVFVGNLPLKVKKKTLLKEFKRFGEVESVRIRSVPLQDTKKPRKGAILAKKINESGDSVHAYIVFKTEESAQASLSYNMTVIEGNHIRVDRACPPRKKLKGESTLLYDNKRTVFVGNLPFDVKDEELYQLFCGISNLESSIEAVRVVRDPHLNVGKGIAYVLFKTREAANIAVKKRYLKLRDRELRLSHAKLDATPSKRPNPSPAQNPNTPARKVFVASRSPLSSNNRSNKKSNASYQGLRANKSGGVQKASYQGLRANKSGGVQKTKRVGGGEKPKERMTKRPSVAARKAKANLAKDGAPSKQAAGVKRKSDSRTPDSSLRHKKFKKTK